MWAVNCGVRCKRSVVFENGFCCCCCAVQLLHGSCDQRFYFVSLCHLVLLYSLGCHFEPSGACNLVFITDYTYSLDSGPTNNTGDIKVEFMNITGRTCSDGWDDNDAKVFCKELGFQFGAAYEHFLYTGYYLYYAYNGPYWMTDVNCQGTESSLRDCQKTVGRVSQCRSGKAAGVLCTNTEGK